MLDPNNCPTPISPSGGNAGFTTYKIDKALTTSKLVMQRRKIELDQIEEDILTHIYNTTAQYRNWEN